MRVCLNIPSCLNTHRDKETTKSGEDIGRRGRKETAKAKGRVKEDVISCVPGCRSGEVPLGLSIRTGGLL